MITLSDCVARTIYAVKARNFTVAVYAGANRFIGIRLKFGARYLFTEVGDVTCHPIVPIGRVPDTVQLAETLGSECRVCKRAVLWAGPPAPAPWLHVEGGEYDHVVMPQAISNTELFEYLNGIASTRKE